MQSNNAIKRYALVPIVFIAVPWLNPFATGPTPAVVPWLISATCAILLWWMWTGLTPKTISTGWLVASLVSAAIGLLQFFGQTEPWGMWVNHAAMGEAYGNLRQRNQFATLTSIGLMALLWLVGQHRQEPFAGKPKSAHPGVRWLCWLAGAALLAAANAVSGSRTGLLQWCLVLCLLFVWRRHMKGRTLVVGTSAVAFYYFAIRGMPWVLEATTGFRVTGLLGRLSDEAGCGSRRVLWSNVLHLIAQKPWLGWGWGELDYAHFTTLYPGERFCDILDNAHNLPLHLAAELGLPVAFATCGAGLWLVLRARPWLEADPTRQMAWSVLAVIGLHSLLEYPLWYGPFQIAGGLSLWLILRAHSTNSVHTQPFASFKLAKPLWRAWAAVFLIATCAVVAWDYWRVSQLYLLPEHRSAAYREDTANKVRNSHWFKNQVQFAELTTTPVTAENAAQIREMALQLLHFSPEPRVVEKLVESAVQLGREEEALYFLVRYRAAFPDAHAQWAAKIAHANHP